MDLDRGTLARIDRKVLSGLAHNEVWQMVRVPAAKAIWAAWKRYCDSCGISMGRGIAALIQNELRSVVDDSNRATVFLAEREAELAKRQRLLDVRERNVEIREQRLRTVPQTQSTPIEPRPAAEFVKVSRNDPCTCGSGVKYKRCHGG
ncbi:MAG: SEC-C metal-binding domain-containing protein [Acidimicrobiia bacterium]